MDSPAPSAARPERLVSLDAYRGFVMFLMAAEMLQVHQVAKHYGGTIWSWLDFHTSHVAWTGCSLHDLIQPSFSFMVGVALPFSLASRASKGQSSVQMWGHALLRSLLLILLGVFLRSVGDKITYWTFEDTLSQIGLGYPLLFALGLASTRVRWSALAIILVGYWALFACYNVPPDWTAAAAKVPANWSHDATGLAAHWNLNHNAAWAFDTWFLNLFPRTEVFAGHPGGYSTLSFITTLGTMLLGLIGGQWLKDRGQDQEPLPKLLVTGVACLALGYLLHITGLCPSVKRIWTPSWTLFSGGWCFLLMAAFYGVLDVAKQRGWAFPLVVIGMNSIAMYVTVHLWETFIGKALHTHFGHAPFQILGKPLEPMLHGAAVLLILWLILLWMHRRKLYLRL